MLHFTSYWTFSAQDRGYRSSLFMKVFWYCFPLLNCLTFCSEKHGSTVKTKCMCSFIFCFTEACDWKTHFLLKPQETSKKFCVAQVVHELPNILFFSFSSWTIFDMCFGTLLWKVKTYLLSPFCAFFILPTMFYGKDISNYILQMELCSFEHRST